jgi:hypothetical protein
LCASGRTSQSVTHLEIAPGLARLTPEFFAVGLLEKKIYLGCMSILSILLSVEPGIQDVTLLLDVSDSNFFIFFAGVCP